MQFRRVVCLMRSFKKRFVTVIVRNSFVQLQQARSRTMVIFIYHNDVLIDWAVKTYENNTYVKYLCCNTFNDSRW